MYQLIKYDEFDYTRLQKIRSNKYRGKGKRGHYSNAIIMLDTETSKSGPVQYDKNGDIMPQPNYVVAFTISIRFKGENICTLYGNKPSQCMECINNLRNNLIGDIFIYIFNLPYDWMFLRQYFFESFGFPKRQLCIKSHDPILFEFDNGIILKDAYVLSGRKLEKWADDLNVEHKKAVGSWDYDLIRQQNGYEFTEDELHYIEHDTLSGVECIETTMRMLHKNISTIPYTVTGIVRNEVQMIGEKNRAHDRFLRMCSTHQTQQKLESAFHGGYTHGNRYHYGKYIGLNDPETNVIAYDFASSYPFIMLAFKLPCTRFCQLDGKYSLDQIIYDSDDYAFLFKLIAVGVDLKDYHTPMPFLQFSKCERIINPVLDNGRVIRCDYCEIMLTETDAKILEKQYNFNMHACVDVEYSYKDYLPRWYTDIVYNLFKDKCTLKGKDAILYQIQKGKLNSCYGNAVQKPCKTTIEENFIDGSYNEKEDFNFEKEYNKYKNKRKSVLNYAWGVWITSMACYNLFQLFECVDYENGGRCLYADTDSCYADKWDLDKINAYNEECKRRLKANDYDPIIFEGREYCPGVAELDGVYSEFVYVGAKRYACRDAKTGKLKITVAGVPKSGAVALKDDIRNFKMGFIFPGSITGKLTHSYIYQEKYIDEKGNEVADSIDLNECSYLLKQENIFDFDSYIGDTEDGERNFR